jgi:hypothetical protein
MSLWIKLYSNFYSHRKTAKLRASLGDDAFWIPPRLWVYAVENQPDGDFSSYTAPEIANLIGYTKDADKMLQALLHAGFMDSDPLRIHDWHEHGAVHVAYAEKAKKAANARWERARALKESNQRKENENRQRGDETSIASSIADGSGLNPPPSQPHEQPAPDLSKLAGWQLRKDLRETTDPAERDAIKAEMERRKKKLAKPAKPTQSPQPIVEQLPVDQCAKLFKAAKEKAGL